MTTGRSLLPQLPALTMPRVTQVGRTVQVYNPISFPESLNPRRINLGVAESSLMHQELIAHFTDNVRNTPMSLAILSDLHCQFEIDAASHLTYGAGPNGSPRLRNALATYFESFGARKPVRQEDIVITSGVGSMTDSLVWCICNEGEGVLVPRPVYTGFEVDIPMRSRAKLVPVSFVDKDEKLCLDDVFDAKANKNAMESALEQSRADGVQIRAVLLTKYNLCQLPQRNIVGLTAFLTAPTIHSENAM